jgi:hypothetical protein
MFNLVEFAASDDEQSQAPCKWGNIVEGHACYCHADHWKEGPRKCPIWRNFETPGPAWRKVDGPVFPVDGGCPMFEPLP